MNKIVVIANERFEPGLIAFINSYKKAKVSTTEFPLVIIDTGLKNQYPYETIKRDASALNFKRAPWMTDCTPYLQLELADINADKILYLETDMLILENHFNYLFSLISDDRVIAVMDDAALSTFDPLHIDSAGRYFIEGSNLRKMYSRVKGYNGGLIGGTHSFYENLKQEYPYYLKAFEKEYRLLAQSLLNQYLHLENLYVEDVGFEFNFSGINEYYDKEELYKITFDEGTFQVEFNGEKISIVHFTGKDKPWFNDTPNIMRPVWEYYYNKGELF